MELSTRDKVAIGLAAGGALSVVAAGALLAIALLRPAGGTAAATSASPSLEGEASPSAPARSGEPSGDVVVDVQGAVRQPGIVRLPGGSRVADALQAAGGYSKKADLNAAAAALNLAAVLADGAQVYVPLLGSSGAGPAPSAGSGGGLVNLNTATPEELDALPGIGPVTVQKIVAARAEQPFASLDEMVEREVIDRGQLEDIRDLVTL
ncbi:MAG TPA: helix-hairpin-helix domain-containing protein [Candidatus Limnocylindria bacterium]